MVFSAVINNVIVVDIINVQRLLKSASFKSTCKHC